MPACIDAPADSSTVDRFAFLVRGWLWLEHGQSDLVGVEACVGDEVVGASGRLLHRVDVNRAMHLLPDVLTGFEFTARMPQMDRGRTVALGIRGRRRDGSCTDVLCERMVTTFGLDDPKDQWGIRPPDLKPDAVATSAPDFEPPAHLQVRQVAGVWGARFYAEGRVIFGQIAQAFAIGGQPLSEAHAVLDFGCGCGRVLRGFEHMSHRGEVWGCDIDREAIEWNRTNLGHIGRFVVNPSLPPTTFTAAQFDAVYSVSVFTHLPEELQFAWLTELRRILRPGGLLVVSLHGGHYAAKVDSSVQEELAARGFAYRTGAMTEGLPEYYMVAFHSEAYIRTKWARFFEFVALKERWIHGVHDAVIMRRTSD